MESSNKKRMRRGGMVLALGLSGCGVGPTAVSPKALAPRGDRSGLQASVKLSLERLSALQLFTVDRLVMKLPDNAMDCYGVPCPGDARLDAAYDAELARQAGRLATLVEQAQECNSGNCYIYTSPSAEQTVRALNALEVVQVGAMVTAEPQNNPSCYNLPCQADIEAARHENERRATLGLTIATYAKGL